ncbi:TetR/AcrR family transcriptional regulator [Kitasatospora sp. NPDC051853]|uniref:TetR/AcrR family transcriptional regulator n=1 Tax=Kitasatospora sp. NPDC051853 TaxID=3364058 RepID=UPI00379B00A8
MTRAAATSLGRRERNKLRVREGLYKSALRLFAEQGYDGTSIDDIAEDADVARATFFNHFQRKEDLISEWGRHRQAELAASLEELPGPGPEGEQPGAAARLEHCMTVLGRLNEGEREVTVAMLTAWVRAGRPLTERPYLAEIFTRIVETGTARGELATVLPAHQVGDLLHDLYLGTLIRWVQDPAPAEEGLLAARLRSVLATLLEGLSPR